MPLQIRATRWCARQFKRTVRLFPPPSASSFFSLSSPSLAFVWSSGFPVLYPPPSPRPCNPIVDAESRFLGKKRETRERRRRGGGNAVTRENPLRNVFGPCTARYHLQSRACIKYICKKRKEDARNFKREGFGTRGESSLRERKCNAHRRQRRRARENGSQIRFNYEPPTCAFFFSRWIHTYMWFLLSRARGIWSEEEKTL